MSNTLDRSPNQLMRALRGDLSPGEFAAAVRRAAREIGEYVSCDARYVGRIESGEIRCPNYAYERVFRHMFPGCSLQELGFAPRREVRRPGPRRCQAAGEQSPRPSGPFEIHEENDDVHRRTFLTGGSLAVATVLGLDHPAAAEVPQGTRVGVDDARQVEAAVRDIRLLDDAHGADALFDRAGGALRRAYQLLNCGSYSAQVEQRLQAAAGELAISVGWLAHDSGRLADARSFYAEALATARMSDDPWLESHSFCNSAFLARDAGRPREAVRAAQAARQAANGLGSSRLRSLLAMREAGGWALLQDRSACERSIGLAKQLFEAGPADADPEWMSFYGEAELLGLESQCWSALSAWDLATDRARRAIAMQQPQFVRNRALYTAELANDQLGRGELAAAAESGSQVVSLFGEVRSTRIRSMVAGTVARLRPHQSVPEVADFVQRYDAALAG
jgi:hypothetical protein